VHLITLSCSDDCAAVQAVGTGGHPPYTYAWEDGSTNPVRKVCPTADTGYSVRVTDTGQTGELQQLPQTVQASVTAAVLSCPDGGGGGLDGGACVPGTYSGTFTGTGVVDAAAGSQQTVTAPLAIRLAADDGGAGLVFGAPVTLNWDIAADWTPTFTGGLDCATGRFRSEDPKTPETVAGLPAGTCDMIWTGTLDDASQTISGTWTSDCSGVVWGGTWTATHN
jgi:hypothetical protein